MYSFVDYPGGFTDFSGEMFTPAFWGRFPSGLAFLFQNE